jgi:lysosomal alpha-mannosidase
VPYSWNKVGSKKTIDQTYMGTENKGFAHARVQTIFDTVFYQLAKDASRRYTIIQIKYFEMWYTRLDPKRKEEVKKIIKDGQVEFAQGGWVSPDEACPNYEDFILNIQVGQQFLQKEFGVRPTVAWNVGVYGHSAAAQALFADFGLEAQFFDHMLNEPKGRREVNHSQTFLWEPFARNQGDNKQILTHIFRRSYGWPDVFAVDELKSADDPFITDPSLEGYNKEWKVNEFINLCQEIANNSVGNENIVVPFGDDFAYMNAMLNWEQIDNLVKYVNEQQKVNLTVVQSTPGAFINALKRENVKYPVYNWDYVLSSIDKGFIFSGIFSNKPDFKKQIKDYSALYHAQSRFFAKRVINHLVKDEEIKRVMNA